MHIFSNQMEALLPEENYVVIRAFYAKWLIKKNWLLFSPIKLITINLLSVPINITST